MELVTLSEIARRLRLSPKTLRKMKDQLPGKVLINGRPRYQEDAVMHYFRSQFGGHTESGAQSQPNA